MSSKNKSFVSPYYSEFTNLKIMDIESNMGRVTNKNETMDRFRELLSECCIAFSLIDNQDIEIKGKTISTSELSSKIGRALLKEIVDIDVSL